MSVIWTEHGPHSSKSYLLQLLASDPLCYCKLWGVAFDSREFFLSIFSIWPIELQINKNYLPWWWSQIFFLVMFLTTVKTRKLCEHQNLWHSGWWEVKSVLLLVSMALPFFFPSELVQIYGKFVFFLHNFENDAVLIIVILMKQVLLGAMHSDISYSWSFVFYKWFLYNNLG